MSNELTIYGDSISPPVRSVYTYAKALNLPFKEVKLDLFKNEHREPHFLNLNPLHKVPVLVNGDIILTDSHAILFYLAENYDIENVYWPNDKKDQARVMNRLMFDATNLFPLDSQLITTLLFGPDEEIPKIKSKVRDLYDVMEGYLSTSKFMATDNLTIADISIGCTLVTIALEVPICETQYRLLNNWMEEFKSRDWFQVNKEGLERLHRKIKKEDFTEHDIN